MQATKLSPRNDAELWFRPSHYVSFQDLSSYIADRKLTATPRLGSRDEYHPKGYKEGETAILRVYDEYGKEHTSVFVLIKSVTVIPLQTMSSGYLKKTHIYSSWQQIQEELSAFEQRIVDGCEDVTIVEFSYL